MDIFHILFLIYGEEETQEYHSSIVDNLNLFSLFLPFVYLDSFVHGIGLPSATLDHHSPW